MQDLYWSAKRKWRQQVCSSVIVNWDHVLTTAQASIMHFASTKYESIWEAAAVSRLESILAVMLRLSG